MVKGKKKKKNVQESSQKRYSFITLEEVHAREMKYMNRLEDLKECFEFIDEAMADVEELKKSERKLEEWRNYLACDGVPKPNLPPQVRLLFVKLRFFEEIEDAKTKDWLMSVDERSILTQNIFIKDLTRKTLVKELRPNFGQEYEINIDLSLKVLKLIDYYLSDETLTAKCSPRILLDIMEQKAAVQDEIAGFMDRYTYKILSSEDAYMNSVNAITSDYSYVSNNFKIHLWTLKNVPIIFEFLEDPFLVAELHAVGAKVQIPLSILEENLTLRCLHFHYDHCSEHAKSYEQTVTIPTKNLNAGIQDIHDCLINEWNMQMDLQNEVRNKMILKRVEYEEKMKLIEEMAAESKGKKKDDKKEKKSKKAPKAPKEPPIITNDTYPDIWEDFLEKEKMEFEEFMNAVYHPSVLNLLEGEVNMKQYIILGGIYQMDFVTKPIHYTFDKYSMTWHVDNGVLNVKKNVQVVVPRQTIKSIMASQYSIQAASLHRQSMMSVGTRKSSFQRRMTRARSTMIPEGSPLIRMFLVSITLPEHLCLWGEPMACQFEDDVIGYIEPPTVIEAPSARTSITGQPTGEGDADGGDNLAGALSQLGVEEYQPKLSRAMSRLSVSNLFRPSISSVNLKRMTSSTFGDRRWEIDDFELDMMLSKSQIRNLERYCIPRILSSFKFPNEVKEEESEEYRNRPRGKGGVLVRKHQQIDDGTGEPRNDRLFKMNNQNNPERLFPYFPKEERLPMRYRLENYMDFVDDVDPQTFSQLLEVINRIKKFYLTFCYKTLFAQRFRSKVKIKSIQLLKPPRTTEVDFRPSGTSVSSQRRRTLKSFSASRASQASLLKTQTSISSDRSERSNQSEITMESQYSLFPALPEPVDNRVEFKYARWTTEHIIHSEYDRENCRVTLWTDRLGTFGFAFDRYEHFPFRYWSLEPSEDNPDNEIVLTLETQYVTCVLYVTNDGYRGHVTESTKKFVRNRAMYLVIDEPLTDFKELKKLFSEKNINIFSDHDARFYIKNGYFCEKHLAAELHTYSAMAAHCVLTKFNWSEWNRLAQRRDIILHFAPLKDAAENDCLVRITPEDATFVDVKELCSNDINVIKLEYTPTWRNIDYYADLNNLIVSVSPAAAEMRVTDSQLICCVKNLLYAIRPLSYS